MDMTEKKNMEVIGFIWKQRKLIIIVAAIAAALSIIITTVIPPKFKSVSRVYPANLQLFSDESPTEQLLQWMQSEEIKKMFMNNREFNLIEHYDINPQDKLKDYYFDLVFDERFDTRRTEYQSIELSVIDQDAETAQQLNYAYISFADSLIRKAHNDKIEEFTKMLNSALKRQVKAIDSLKTILYFMAAKYDINDYKIQLKEVNKNYLKQLGNGKESKELKDLLNNLGQKGPDQYLIVRMIETEIDQYNALRIEYETKIKDLNKHFTYSVIIQKPNLPDAKFWPRKGLIVLIVVVSSVFILILALLFLEKIKKGFN